MMGLMGCRVWLRPALGPIGTVKNVYGWVIQQRIVREKLDAEVALIMAINKGTVLTNLTI
jgi:hypothetical protein